MDIKQIKLVLSFGTNFEYYDDFNLGFSTFRIFMKKLKQIVQHLLDNKKQEGNYFDTFLNLSFDYDKRNQKFRTDDGFRSTYTLDITSY